jgi:glycosyltransferase involved in cell wall biosynthesis
MNILFVSAGFSGSGTDYPSTLADELQHRGHDVSGLCFAAYPQINEIEIKTTWTLRSIDRFIWKNITNRHPWVTGSGRWLFNWFLYHRWKRAVANELEATEHDIVVTTRITTAPTVIAASEQEIPSIIITTGPATVKYDPSDKKTDKTPDFDSFPMGKKIQYPFIQAVHRWNHRAFTEASEIIATNEFDASITRDTFGQEPQILHIPVPLTEFETESGSESSITLVNPRDSNKGLDTFLQIAQRLSEQEFLIAGSLYDDSLESTINEMSNVTYLGWCSDMASVYAKTKLLLVPSTYQEGGPRVIIEAFADGIPAIGSDIGGIPDYIGDGGDVIEDYTNPEAWVTTIKQYTSDTQYYEQKSRCARQRSQLFDYELIVDEFTRILRNTLAES